MIYEKTSKQCWKCNDGNDYVFGNVTLENGVAYKFENSFGYSSSVCRTGLSSTLVDSCNFTSSSWNL